MKKQILIPIVMSAILSLNPTISKAQGMAVNTTGVAADASAMMDIASNSQGILVPRMDSTHRATIGAPATGLMVYQTNGVTPGFYFYNGSAWAVVGGMPAGSATGDMLYWNGVSWSSVPAGINGQIFVFSGGVPSWANSNITILSTTAISSITANTAISGGNITSDGGNAITARGVCWNTAGLPTVALTSRTSNGTGTGAFTSNMTGLAGSTTYHVRAYATTSAGTSYGNDQTFTTPFGIGAAFNGGVLAYILQPGDPGYSTTVQHGLIATPTDQSSGIIWGCPGTLVGTLTALGTGQANTSAIVSACGAGTAAQLCDALVVGGFSDWYLPSKDELFKLVSVGTSIGMTSVCYWTSSEINSANSYMADPTPFSFASTKNSPVCAGHVRAVRSF